MKFFMLCAFIFMTSNANALDLDKHEILFSDSAQNQKLTLHNKQQHDVQIFLKIQTLTMNEKLRLIPNNSGQYSLKNWLDFPEFLIVPAGGSKEIILNLKEGLSGSKSYISHLILEVIAPQTLRYQMGIPVRYVPHKSYSARLGAASIVDKELILNLSKKNVDAYEEYWLEIGSDDCFEKPVSGLKLKLYPGVSDAVKAVPVGHLFLKEYGVYHVTLRKKKNGNIVHRSVTNLPDSKNKKLRCANELAHFRSSFFLHF